MPRLAHDARDTERVSSRAVVMLPAVYPRVLGIAALAPCTENK